MKNILLAAIAVALLLTPVQADPATFIRLPKSASQFQLPSVSFEISPRQSLFLAIPSQERTPLFLPNLIAFSELGQRKGRTSAYDVRLHLRQEPDYTGVSSLRQGTVSQY